MVLLHNPNERIRKQILLRSFNRNKNKESSLEDQWRSWIEIKDGSMFIPLSKISSNLGLKLKSLQWEFKDCLYELEYVYYKTFLNFLKYGKTELPTGKTNHVETNKSLMNNVGKDDMISNAIESFVEKNKTNKVNSLNPALNNLSSESQDIQLEFSYATSLTESSRPESTALTLFTPDKSVVKNTWRKSEIIRQERIISYIAIDNDGVKQELCEKEVTETEILHMENRDTDEFAHRETTVLHRSETFNNEVVTDTTDKEEYVHLKSLDNEIEYQEGCIPSRHDHSSQCQSRRESTYQSMEKPQKAYENEMNDQTDHAISEQFIDSCTFTGNSANLHDIYESYQDVSSWPTFQSTPSPEFNNDTINENNCTSSTKLEELYNARNYEVFNEKDKVERNNSDSKNRVSIASFVDIDE